jgi:hypothetical protein
LTLPSGLGIDKAWHPWQNTGMDEIVRGYLSAIGQRGGKAKSPNKIRASKRNLDAARRAKSSNRQSSNDTHDNRTTQQAD